MLYFYTPAEAPCDFGTYLKVVFLSANLRFVDLGTGGQ